jgi:hypothetical protein
MDPDDPHGSILFLHDLVPVSLYAGWDSAKGLSFKMLLKDEKQIT